MRACIRTISRNDEETIPRLVADSKYLIASVFMQSMHSDTKILHTRNCVNIGLQRKCSLWFSLRHDSTCVMGTDKIVRIYCDMQIFERRFCTDFSPQICVVGKQNHFLYSSQVPSTFRTPTLPISSRLSSCLCHEGRLLFVCAVGCHCVGVLAEETRLEDGNNVYNGEHFAHRGYVHQRQEGMGG